MPKYVIKGIFSNFEGGTFTPLTFNDSEGTFIQQTFGGPTTSQGGQNIPGHPRNLKMWQNDRDGHT